MKHKRIGFLHLMGGKQGEKGRRKMSVEVEFKDTDLAYLFALTIRIIFVFGAILIEIAKKQEESDESSFSQETTNNDSV